MKEDMSNHSKSIVSIVGAGPGDPELLTIKALKCLQAADVVLYDGLFGDDILELIPDHVETIYVGKRKNDNQDQVSRQNAINQLILKHVNNGKKVVRLKTGDPLIFGRGIEEIRFLREHQLAYEIIPGVTAGIAAANLMQIPITERSINSSVLFCTGSTVNDDFDRLEAIAEMMKEGSPLVIYMGLNNLQVIIDRLSNHGVSRETRVCVVSKVSQPEQDMVEGNFEDIFNKLAENPLKTPVVILMGEHTQSLL